jgi:hypothetical protein
MAPVRIALLGLASCALLAPAARCQGPAPGRLMGAFPAFGLATWLPVEAALGHTGSVTSGPESEASAAAAEPLLPRWRLPKPERTLVAGHHDPARLSVKFADDLGAQLAADDLGEARLEFPEGSLTAEEDSVIRQVSAYGSWSRAIGTGADRLERIRQKAIQASRREMFDFRMLFTFELKAPDAATVADLCDELNGLDVVEFALPIADLSTVGPPQPGPADDDGWDTAGSPGLLEEESSPVNYPSDDPRSAWDDRGITGEGVAIWVIDFNMARDATGGADLPPFLADVPVFTFHNNTQYQHGSAPYPGGADGGAEVVRLAGAPRDGVTASESKALCSRATSITPLSSGRPTPSGTSSRTPSRLCSTCWRTRT